MTLSHLLSLLSPHCAPPPPPPSPISRLPPELLSQILLLLTSPPTAKIPACSNPFHPLAPASQRFMMMPSLLTPDVGELFLSWRSSYTPLLLVCRLWHDIVQPLLLPWHTIRSWQELHPLSELLSHPLPSAPPDRPAGIHLRRLDIALVPSIGDHTHWTDQDAWSSTAVSHFLSILSSSPRLVEILVHGHIPLRRQSRDDPTDWEYSQMPFIPHLPPGLKVLQLPAGLRLTDRELQELAERCEGLEKLAFSGECEPAGLSEALAAASLGSEEGEEQRGEVVGTLRRLRALDVLMDDPALCSPSSTAPCLTSVLSLPKLERLRVTTLLDEDASPSIRAHFTRAILPVASSLRSLEIRGASHWTDRTLWDHTLLWSVLPLLPKLEDLVLDAFMDAPLDSSGVPYSAASSSASSTHSGSSSRSSSSTRTAPSLPPIPSVRRILLRGYYESLYWSVQVYAYEECMSRLSLSLQSLLSPSLFPSLKLLRVADIEPWSPRTRKYRETFPRWAAQMEVTERFTRFPTEEYEQIAEEVDGRCKERGVRLENRFGEVQEGGLGAQAPVEWCWPQYVTDLYRVAGAVV